jgi:pilus assembly protein CpaF
MKQFGKSRIHVGKKESKEKDVKEEELPLESEAKSIEESGKEASDLANSITDTQANTNASSSSFQTPVHLKSYLDMIEDPEAMRVKLSEWGGGDPKFHERIESFAEIVSQDLHDTLDATILAAETDEEIKKEILEFVDTINEHRSLKLTANEIQAVAHVIEDDILGLGPLEELLENDDIADIMVDGPKDVYIEINGHIEKTDIHFRSVEHLVNVCRRIVNRVGRRVDEASPICDARLEDGSRVNVIFPPLALEGPNLTIRKFKRDRLTLEKLLKFGTLDDKTAALLQIIAACRINVLVSGGTGSGKTTLLNCLTKYISPTERIITCEDAAELQLQQPGVVRLETRPMNTEGYGLVTMRDLVKNCLRMRPERIIVGEVRGPEAFDLMQAMNTGHDGSMGTLHANSPRDALFRLENMVAMANLGIPISALREQIASSLEVIIHTQRLRDGSRKIMNISEIVGLEGNLVTMQDLMHFEITGEDNHGNIQGEFKFAHINPKFHKKAKHYNMDKDLIEIIGQD